MEQHHFNKLPSSLIKLSTSGNRIETKNLVKNGFSTEWFQYVRMLESLAKLSNILAV